MSSVGKGIIVSSIGKILQSMGYKVYAAKMDPYVNVDAGTMNPYQHGEVFVTEDGGETDLDLGHYERFLDIQLDRNANITTGLVYKRVIEKERKGEYLGQTVQIIPHVVDEIKSLYHEIACAQRSLGEFKRLVRKLIVPCHVHTPYSCKGRCKVRSHQVNLYTD